MTDVLGEETTTTDVGLFGPDSVTWRVHSHPSMLIGGMRALMLQALEPRAMAAVAEHSDFRTDIWGRMRRTAEYVTNTTFGDTATARRSGATVRAIHDHISGVDSYTGRPYHANDRDLLAWIHNVEVDSFLSAYRHYGGRMSLADADQYVAEMVRVAELVGLDAADVPGSLDGLDAYLGAYPMDASPAARAALPFLVVPPVDPPNLGFRVMWSTFAAAAVAILPKRARDLYRLTWIPLADQPLKATVGAFLKVADATMPPSPVITAAYARVGRTPPHRRRST